MSLIDSDGNLNFQKVQFYFSDDHTKLTEKDIERLKRWERLHELYKEHRVRDKAIKAYCKLYDISARTAYLEWNYVVMVFSEMEHFDKKYERAWAADWLRKMMTIAQDQQDGKAFAALMDKYDKILRLSSNDIEAPPDFKKRAPAKVVMSFDNLLAPHPMTPELEKEIEKLKHIEGLIISHQSKDGKQE